MKDEEQQAYCPHIERKLITGERLSGEEHLHLLECRGCQEFAALHGELLHLQNQEALGPSKATEDAIFQAWQKSGSAFPRRSWVPRVCRYVAGIAAAIALACLVVRQTQTGSPSLPPARQIARMVSSPVMPAEENAALEEDGVVTQFCSAVEECSDLECMIASIGLL